MIWLLLPLIALADPKPTLPTGSLELKKTTLTISYDKTHKQPDWVFYRLSAWELRNCVNRGKGFRADPQTPGGATLSDYKDSGYDRGHLSPAGDNKWAKAAMDDSFFLTNVSPQVPKFNKNTWNKLETLVRAWAIKKEGIWVATGPILRPNMETIGENEVSVPDTFFKAILTMDGKQGIGMLVRSNDEGDLKQYAVTIDQVEKESGIDFFHGIDNEEKVESTLNLKQWNFQEKFQYLPCK